MTDKPESRTCNGCTNQPICKVYDAAKALYECLVSAKAESFRQNLNKLVAEACHLYSPLNQK